jgi:hypothetical protein
MSPPLDEDKIILALKAIQDSKKNCPKPLSVAHAARIYRVP